MKPRVHPEWDWFKHVLELTPTTAQFEIYHGRFGDDPDEPAQMMRRGAIQDHVWDWVDENIQGGWGVKIADHCTDPKYIYETILIGFHDPVEAELFDKTWLQA